MNYKLIRNIDDVAMAQYLKVEVLAEVRLTTLSISPENGISVFSETLLYTCEYTRRQNL